MFHFSKMLSVLLCALLLIAAISPSAFAQSDQQQSSKAKEREKKEQKRAQKDQPAEGNRQTGAVSGGAPRTGETETVEVIADRQSQNGDLLIAEGYVNASQGDLRLQADHITFNTSTGDMVAEGNVIFDQGADQRVTARRAEINWTSRRGTFWDTTGFTNRTQTGEYIFFTAERVEKTGPATYKLIEASITSCEDAVPKWSFHAKHAELEMGDQVKLYNSVFRVKGFPAFVLPYAWIPATESERKSGFLLPTTGSSNQKGRTLKTAYYQTLGKSSDITFRNDIYSARGIGMGAEFRAQTDERSFMRLGVFTVKDRLFGEPGEDQGGTAFFGEAVQYLPHGWLAVGNASLVTSLRFRQVFSDDISQIIDPRRESSFYLNNNAGSFSVNFLAANETTTLFRPASDPDSSPTAGTNFDIGIRQAPEFNLTVYPRRILSRLPIYLSIDASVGAFKREETANDETVLITPSAVQRFDFQSKVTAPLATFAGVAITPSFTLRETFYTRSLDPTVTAFNPDLFALTASDPRLDASLPEFDPQVSLFDRTALDPIIPDSILRHYAELEIDIRPPALEKEFLDREGLHRFKHVIEPYITYRLIGGVGEDADSIIRFDERDVVANTNEFEYAMVNRFFTRRQASDFRRKRSRRQSAPAPSEMQPERPGKRERKGKPKESRGAEEQGSRGAVPQHSRTSAPPQAPKPDVAGEKQKLETGEQAALKSDAVQEKREGQTGQTDKPGATDEDEEDADTADVNDSPVQAYEFLSIKVAQKYFFDRDFGGALEAGRRNQFYPINTLSGFTFGGRARDFSPVNLQVRYRPLSSIFADLRMDLGREDDVVRNLALGGGVTKDKITLSANWYLSRRIDISPNSFEPGTFPGNQIITSLQYGDEARGLYAGTRIGYDFTDRFISDDQLSTGRLRNSRSYLGYGWDCCGVQFNYNTFKAGLRNESAFSFTFTLAGIGSFGTAQISELGGGGGGRKRGRKTRRDIYDEFQ
ncbi:MAG: hypothetical protein L0229_15045 [Blastocatellia bacterium]|nr:hypothetical protein [Blastocatellia bacterium]